MKHHQTASSWCLGCIVLFHFFGERTRSPHTPLLSSDTVLPHFSPSSASFCPLFLLFHVYPFFVSARFSSQKNFVLSRILSHMQDTHHGHTTRDLDFISRLNVLNYKKIIAGRAIINNAIDILQQFKSTLCALGVHHNFAGVSRIIPLRSAIIRDADRLDWSSRSIFLALDTTQ